ncbi:MAG TPA: hypothetical protein PKE29_15520 [Phycisphaerales bacterium]|nr:hypothetical protein [Phycisphaerales bacterium]
MFSDTEADAPSHCCACGDLIPHRLTPDGLAYVREAVTDGSGDSVVLASWAHEYLPEGV